MSKKQDVKNTDDEAINLKRKIVEEFYVKKENLAAGEEESDSDSEVSEDEVPSLVLKELLPKNIKKSKILQSKIFLTQSHS